MFGKDMNKFWNCLKAIANLFDFTVQIVFVDGRVTDFKIKHNESEVMMLEEEAG